MKKISKRASKILNFPSVNRNNPRKVFLLFGDKLSPITKVRMSQSFIDSRNKIEMSDFL